MGRRLRLAGLGIAIITALTLVPALKAGAATHQSGSFAGTSAAASAYTRVGLVRFVSGGCLTLTNDNLGSRVQVQPCGHGGYQTWFVRRTATTVMFQIKGPYYQYCVRNEHGLAIDRSCYASGVWLPFRWVGNNVLIYSGGRMTSFGYGWAVRFVPWATANAGRQLLRLP